MSGLLRSITFKRLLIGGLWLGSLAGAVLFGALAHKYRDQIRGRLSASRSTGFISTNLYDLAVQKVHVPADGRDGGLAVLGDGLLLASRTGALWYVDSSRTPHPLTTRVPINFDAFVADVQPQGLINAEQFAVKDLEVQRLGDSVRVLASHNYWNAERRCYVLRISALETSEATLRSAEATALSWRTVFDSAPCSELSTLAGGGSPHPTLGAGGRLAVLSDTTLLVTIGGFIGEAELPNPEHYWNAGNSYGKTIRVNLVTGESQVFTVGHRNPQGLVATADGRLFLTEHAARGGDELNLLTEGANFGYPAVSYGTAYGQMVWPSNPRQGRHEGFAKPMFAWVPSLGISQVTEIRRDGFPDWRGDLIVASLAMEHLYRVRIEGGRTIFVEPMRINHRGRDIVEAPDGSLVVKTDDDFLIFLTRVDAGSPESASLPPVRRGQLLAAACMSCHAFEASAPDGIGPNLHGVGGRAVAGRAGYTYSSALRRADGRWTTERLRAYIGDPAAFAPGTTMLQLSPLDSGQISALVAYLESVR
jgi:cytochrome c2